MLAELFDPGRPYSASVDARRNATDSIRSVSEALSAMPRTDVPRIPTVNLTATTTISDVREPATEHQKGFASALEQFAKTHGQDALATYPEMARWLAARV